MYCSHGVPFEEKCELCFKAAMIREQGLRMGLPQHPAVKPAVKSVVQDSADKSQDQIQKNKS